MTDVSSVQDALPQASCPSNPQSERRLERITLCVARGCPFPKFDRSSSTMDHIQAAQIIQANQDHFNKLAVDGGYDDNPFVEQVSRQIAQAIRQEFTFEEESTLLLDYACGTGINH